MFSTSARDARDLKINLLTIATIVSVYGFIAY